jgi:hypothetical protein
MSGRGPATRVCAILAAAGSFACNSSSSGGPVVVATAEIGPEGGSLVASDGTRVDIPGGALGTPVTLTLELASDAPLPSGGTFVGAPYALQPEWIQFAQPVFVTLTVDPSQLPAGSSLDGVLVLTAAAGDDGGYLALPSTMADATHVTARTTHFSIGGSAVAGCPVQCATSEDPAGPILQCSTTCVGHTYSLSCAGPPGSEPCTCATDGVVTAVGDVDAGDLGTIEGAYTASCDFPSTSWAGVGDAGPD